MIWRYDLHWCQLSLTDKLLKIKTVLNETQMKETEQLLQCKTHKKFKTGDYSRNKNFKSDN